MKQVNIKRIVPALLKWYAASARDLPWRRVRDPYATWISEIMLQQTQVKTVIPYFERWMKRLPTLPDFAQAGPQVVLKLWEGLGYYRRARHAHAAARLVMQKYEGRFPRDFEEILALPGIGRYTAGAIASIAFDQSEPILDGNVIRVLCRLFGVAGDPREKSVNHTLWELARSLVSFNPTRCASLNQSLMELGALVCTPRQPACPTCPVRGDCFAFQAKRVEEFPMLQARPDVTQRRFVAFVAKRADRFLVRQRPAGVVNAHLWEFPNVEVLEQKNAGSALPGSTPFRILEEKPLCTVKHSITRYRILLEAYAAEPAGDWPDGWKTLEQLNRLPFTSAHRKVLRHVANSREV